MTRKEPAVTGLAPHPTRAAAPRPAYWLTDGGA